MNNSHDAIIVNNHRLISEDLIYESILKHLENNTRFLGELPEEFLHTLTNFDIVWANEIEFFKAHKKDRRDSLGDVVLDLIKSEDCIEEFSYDYYHYHQELLDEVLFSCDKSHDEIEIGDKTFFVYKLKELKDSIC